MFILVHFIFGLLAMFSAIMLPGSCSPYKLSLMSVVIPLLYTVNLIYRLKVFKIRNFFDYFSLFSVGYIIVFCQIAFMLPFYPELDFYDSLFFKITGMKGIMLAISGYLFFSGGYIYMLKKKYDSSFREVRVPVNNLKLKLMGYGLSFLSLSLYGLFLYFDDGSFFVGALSTGGISPYFFILSSVVMIMALGLEFYRLKNVLVSPNTINTLRHFNKVTIVVLIFIFTVQAYAGDRGLILTYVSIILCGYSSFLNPIGLLRQAVIIVFGFLFFAIIMQYRGYSDYGRTASRRLDRAFIVVNNYKWYNFTLELASSAKILNVTIESTPSGIPHTKGSLLAYKFVSIVPFVNRYVNSTTSAQIITNYLFPVNPGKHGAGSSVLGDLFLEFSYYGVLVMALWGALVGYIESKSVKKNAFYSIFFYLTICGYAVYLNRSYLLVEIQPFVWAGVGIYVLNKLFRLNRPN